MVTYEQKKNEAINRMQSLKMSRYCISAFRKGKPWQSENGGILYEIENDKELQEVVKKFEEDYNGLVYHIIFNRTEFGDCYSLLYVSNNPEEWQYDNEDLKDGYAYAYVWNKDDDNCSEFGTIGVQSFGGGIRRYA